MSYWPWILVGVGTLITVSFVLGGLIAAVLGRIADDCSNLIELEMWALWPATRDSEPERMSRHIVGARLRHS